VYPNAGTPCYDSNRLQASSSSALARRRVLIAAPFPPAKDGLHGGAQVIGRLVDELADSHELAVMYFRAENEAPMEAALARRCAFVEEVPRAGGAADPRRLLKLLGAFVRGYPMWAEDWRANGFRERLRKICAHWKPDVVQFECHTMAQYAEAARGQITILVEHEPGAAAARDRWQFSRGWRRLVLARDRRAWDRYETECLAKFDAIVSLTERDRRELLRMRPSARVRVIPPGGPAPAAGTSGNSPSANTILFAGNFIHPPNVDAAMRLAGSIFPLVRARHPDAVLNIVGEAPPACLRRLAAPGVVVTGRVDDITPWLDAAAVVAAPLRLGGGIRIKVMDALYAAKAIVASPLAAEGLKLRDGREFLLAETDAEFAAALSSLLADPAARDRLSACAREWAAQFATPGRVGAAYERLYAVTRSAAEGASCPTPKSQRDRAAGRTR